MLSNIEIPTKNENSIISHATYTEGQLQRAPSHSFPLSPSLEKSLLCPQLSKAPLPIGRPPEKSQRKHPPAQSVLSKLKKNTLRNLSPLVSSPNSPLKLTSPPKHPCPGKIKRINTKAWIRVKIEGRTNRWACGTWIYRISYQVMFMGSKQVG